MSTTPRTSGFLGMEGVLPMGSMEAAAMVLPIVVVGLLGVTSAVLGFIAEAKKLTV